MGKVDWASQVIRGGSTYLRRVLDLKNSVKEKHNKVVLTNDFFADLKWWLSFMKIFNGTCRIQDPVLSPHSKRTPFLKDVEDITIETTFILTRH